MQYGYYRSNIHALSPVIITVISDYYKQGINPGCSCCQKGTGCTCFSGTQAGSCTCHILDHADLLKALFHLDT